jgi:hypothetical protein
MVERQRGDIPADQARAYVLFALIRDGFEAPTFPRTVRRALRHGHPR